jgi:hypothetical protein
MDININSVTLLQCFSNYAPRHTNVSRTVVANLFWAAAHIESKSWPKLFTVCSSWHSQKNSRTSVCRGTQVEHYWSETFRKLLYHETMGLVVFSLLILAITAIGMNCNLNEHTTESHRSSYEALSVLNTAASMHKHKK